MSIESDKVSNGVGMFIFINQVERGRLFGSFYPTARLALDLPKKWETVLYTPPNRSSLVRGWYPICHFIVPFYFIII